MTGMVSPEGQVHGDTQSTDLGDEPDDVEADNDQRHKELHPAALIPQLHDVGQGGEAVLLGQGPDLLAQEEHHHTGGGTGDHRVQTSHAVVVEEADASGEGGAGVERNTSNQEDHHGVTGLAAGEVILKGLVFLTLDCLFGEALIPGPSR